MAGSPYGSVLQSLSEKDLLLPYFRNAILSQKWPDSYNVVIDSSPYYGHGDGYFHPSTHGLMGARELYYRFHPDHRDKIIHEQRNVQSEMTLAMGSALHGIVQAQFQMAGLISSPEHCEVEYIIEEHHVRGRVDFLVHHPDGNVYPVELKSLACSTPILTTRGWTTMGDLRDGDEVYAPDGQPTKVLKAHPINLNRPCYEVTFKDGQKVVTDAEHLWSVSDRSGGQVRQRVMTTKEIADANWYGKNRFRVPITDPLQMPEQNLPVDPWLLGMWLGDGDSSMVSITVDKSDLDYVWSRLNRLGLSHKMNHYSGRTPNVYIHGMRGTFADLGLLHHPRTKLFGFKRIPDQYMLASEAQRRELLAGLMDSDGTVGDHQAVICMTNEPLMRQVLQLVRSLGYRATWSESRATMNGLDCGPVYWVKFSTSWGPSPFAMPRKKQKWDDKPKDDRRVRTNAIVSVTEVDTVPVRCITVAHESALYVAGPGFVPTHNTQNSRAFDFQTEIKEIWDAQLSMGLHGTGYATGILLVLESGYPYRMKEYRVNRNDVLLSQIFAKFAHVRDCIATSVPPEHCCPLDSVQMKACPARFECWLSSKKPHDS